MFISKPAKRAVITLPAQKDLVAETVRAAILSGEMPPGARLNLDAIAGEHGVSRMPVRDALQQLEAEGLITIYPRRGVQVAKLDVDDMEELFGIRTVLEQKAIELAMSRFTEEHFNQLHALLKRMDLMSERGKAWVRANERYHSMLNDVCEWPRLISMVNVLRRNIERYIRAYVHLGGLNVAQEQHWEIYEACRVRDVERAKAVIAEHSAAAAKRLIAVLPTSKGVSTNGVNRRGIRTA